MSNQPDPIETLLAHRAWVRDLARGLVSDENRADDLEQQAWLAALEHPPRHGDSPRGWLATVLRRASGRERRADFRRDRRERAAARPEELPPVDDLVAHTEILERLVRAVLDLDEPYRSAVLLRYFEGLEPGEISRRTGTPVETVLDFEEPYRSTVLLRYFERLELGEIARRTGKSVETMRTSGADRSARIATAPRCPRTC